MKSGNSQPRLSSSRNPFRKFDSVCYHLFRLLRWFLNLYLALQYFWISGSKSLPTFLFIRIVFLLYSWFDSILILDLTNFHKSSGTLLGIALTLENNLNKIDIFTILSLLIDEHSIIIHLSRSSLIPLNSVL